MSGHSKWAQIKRQKGAADIKRGQVFTKLSNAISLAVRHGEGITDPAQNFKLRLVIEKARSVNMPKATIDRAIEKGAGGAKGEGLEEATYEGFGPGGVAIIAEAVTDNKIRTLHTVKNVFEKNGGTLGSVGSVSYQFELKGQIIVRKDAKSLDEIFLVAADAGAQDVEEAGDEVLVYTKPEELVLVKERLESKLRVTDAQLFRKPVVTVSVADRDTVSRLLSFLDKLEHVDDIQKVYANFDIPDEIIAHDES